jgi:hypothetical protein
LESRIVNLALFASEIVANVVGELDHSADRREGALDSGYQQFKLTVTSHVRP